MKTVVFYLNEVGLPNATNHGNNKVGLPEIQNSKFKIQNFLLTGVALLSFFFSPFLWRGVGGEVSANNIQVTNSTLTGQDVSAGANNPANFTLVQFDISWDNSWRTSTYESNWDAAWVFVKVDPKGPIMSWTHATLNYVDGTAANDGHTQPAGSTITTSTDGKGVFIYRSADGVGSNSWLGVQLKWNYVVDGLADDDSVEICVFAIEMVYVPQGAFWAGDGSTNPRRRQFHQGNNTTIPFLVDDENAITLGGTVAANMSNNDNTGYGDYADDFNYTTTKTLPAAFPKGYNAFYCMKYEVTQGQYVEMMNKLTNPQMVNVGYTINNYRQDITGGWPSYMANTPYRPIARVWQKMVPYLDWAALRPMTELEYEKACRGDTSVGTWGYFPDEYAWGDTTATQATGVSNDGLNNEQASNAAANSVWGPGFGTRGSTAGPLRVGSFARAGTTTRDTTGATYYGIMEMSGNLWEAVISVGHSTPRAFTGVHGDGALTGSGYANVSGWPYQSGSVWMYGLGFRGGSYYNAKTYMRVSDRMYGTASSHSSWGITQPRGTNPEYWMGYNTGFRGVRSSP